MAQDAVTARGARRLLVALAAASFLGLAGRAEAAVPGEPPVPSSQEPEISGYVETLEVRLVLLQATVLDRRGEVVTGLTPSSFQLAEDGVPQKITAFGTSEDQPLQVAFLLDVSGSMVLGGKLERAKAAIHRFARRLQPGDKLALLIFADGGVVVKKGLTADRAAFFTVLRGLTAWGQTALRDALADAPSIMEGAGPGRKAIVLLTDGVDNASEMTVFDAIRAAREVPVPIYTLGLTDLTDEAREERQDDREGRSFFEVLAEFGKETGGEILPVFNEEDLEEAVTLVEHRLRAQYIIGYRPSSNPDAPGFRKIDLKSADPKHRVITRTGYYGRR